MYAEHQRLARQNRMLRTHSDHSFLIRLCLDLDNVANKELLKSAMESAL
jgi:hypothetical protein